MLVGKASWTKGEKDEVRGVAGRSPSSARSRSFPKRSTPQLPFSRCTCIFHVQRTAHSIDYIDGIVLHITKEDTIWAVYIFIERCIAVRERETLRNRQRAAC